MSDVRRSLESNPFGPEVVEAVRRHMNTDHAEDSVLICRALGGQMAAETAEMTGMDGEGIDFQVTINVRIPWSRPLHERAEIRTEVTRMYREACERLGVHARGE